MAGRERRLDRLEGSLSPTEAIVRWMEEAHGFGSLSEYLRSLLDESYPFTPLDGLVFEVEHAVREGMKGCRREAVHEAVLQAARDVAFLHLLQHNFNEDCQHRSEVLAPVIVLLAWLPLVPPRGRAGDGKEAADRLRRWRNMAMSVFAELHIRRTIAERMSESYFGGHALLYPKAAEELESQIQTLEQLIGFHNERVRAGARRLTKHQQAAVIDVEAIRRAAEEVAPDMLSRTVNEARADTLLKMGDVTGARALYRLAASGIEAAS